MNRFAASKVAFLAVCALGLLYGCATDGGTSSKAADPIVGTWSGRVDQPGSSPYRGVMTLSSPNEGTSSYPSLKCGGTLSGGGSGGVYRFKETITSGRATDTSGGCIDGHITMVVRGDSAVWQWSGSWKGKGYSASGTLYRK